MNNTEGRRKGWNTDKTPARGGVYEAGRLMGTAICRKETEKMRLDYFSRVLFLIFLAEIETNVLPEHLSLPQLTS